MSWCKKLIIPIAFATLVSLTGCNSNTPKASGGDPYGIMPDLDYTGNLDVLCYIQGAGGDQYTDIGNSRVTTSDLTDSNLQRYHAVAKEFRKLYPNIKVNVYVGNIYGENSFDDELITYQNAHSGKLPHLMHLPEAPQAALNRGIAANIGQYNYMKLYSAINKDIMDMFTFGDFVCAVPMFIYPTGMFVNTAMLERNYYPTTDMLKKWTIDELVNVILPTVHDADKGIGGTAVLSNDMIDIISETIDRTLLNDRRVNLNTPEIQELIDLEAKLAESSVYDYTANRIKPAFSQIQTWNYNDNFIKDELYAVEMARSYAASLYSSLMIEENKVGQFDFMPFPRMTEDSDLRVGIVAEGLVVGNQCALGANGKENCNDRDKKAQEAAAAFALFLAADTRAVKSLATTPWLYKGENVLEGNYETLPVIKNNIVFPYNENKTAEYDEKTMTDNGVVETDYQIQLSYYRKNVSSFNGKDGFEEMLRLYAEEFKTSCYAYNTIPRLVPTETGGTKDIMDCWRERYSGSANSARLGQVGWASSVKSRLADWTNEINNNISTAWDLLQENVDSYYGKGKYNVLG